MTYRLAAVNRQGGIYCYLPGATITEGPTWELNTFGRLTFTLPLFDAGNRTLAGINFNGKYIEVVLTRNGTIIWWGVIVTVETTLDDTTAVRTYRCADLLWYFSNRYVGKASRTNYATNPSFELGAGDLSWATVGTITFDNFSSDRSKLGQHAGKITNATADQDWYIYEDVLAFTSTGVGDLLTAVAWYYIENDGSFTGPPLGGIGLAFIPFGVGGAEPQEEGFAQLTGGEDNPVLGSWQRVKAIIRLPPDVTKDLQVRLYSPGGVIYWDAVQVVRMESLPTLSSATDFSLDQALIMELLVQHAQDPSVLKDDLNIDTNTPATGIKRERSYQFADHANILRSLQEFPGLSDGCDFWIDWAPDLSLPGFGLYVRTFRTGFPHRGTARGFDFGVRVEAAGTYAEGDFRVAAWSSTDDGDQGVTSVTVMGDGDGPDREEAGAIQSSPFLVVEEVIAAPVSTDIDALAGVAVQQLTAKQDPKIWTAKVARPTWIGVVLPGDTLPAYFAVLTPEGNTIESFYGRVRVVSVAADIDSGMVELTLNRENP